MSNLPADWALKAAIIAGGPDGYEYDPDDLRIVKNTAGESLHNQRLSKSIIAHARLIEQTQPAPVDRKLLCAREAIARIQEKRGNTTVAALIRAGDFDHEHGDMIDAITLWDDGFGEDPEATVPQCQ